LKRGSEATSVSPRPVLVTKAVGKNNELRVPVTLFSTKQAGKSLQTTAIVDSGAGGTFISWMFVRKHKITTHKLSKPFHIRTADGSHSKDGKVTDFCMLIIKIDHRFMRGKFNITQLSERDDILLGYPWLAATSPDIDWAKQTISMTPTPRSKLIKTYLKKLLPKRKASISEEIPESFSPINPLPAGGKRTMEKIKKKEKLPPLLPDPDEEDSPTDWDTKEDVWVNETQFAPCIEDPASYPLSDDEVLIEYSVDASSLRLIENLSLDSKLTRDGTSKTELRRAALNSPFRNDWILREAKVNYQKTSNKAQEFALAGEQEKKKTFEELVPKYLHDFADVFADDGLNQLPPSRSGIDHRIKTKPGFIPKSSKLYPLSPKETEAVKAFLDEHLKKDFIQPSKSPQASGFFFVGKKDGSLRPCQDYHYINEWTVKNAYPLPLIPPLITKLRDAKYFTKMDICWGYNNILIHPDDHWKAVFKTEFGLFEPKVMFFGLCNSPATFQAYMNQTFQKEIDEGWLVIYMDDILIFSQNLEEHHSQTRRILDILRKERLFLKPTKCTFDAQEVDYLGMIIRPGQVAMDPAKLKGISEWPTPTKVKDVQSFLGVCNFYRHFISHYSDLARPLINLTKKNSQFEWSEDCEAAFQKLKQCFLGQPVLRNPDPV
jgi:hypothetical protein